MNMVMDYAVRMEYITTSPLVNVKTPKKAKTLDDLQKPAFTQIYKERTLD
ncbi:hypothetical protein [Candidatus Enterococcus ikei]|uniref:Uncharacterized protein n=1 Tax=Candidatus Enterococcus ikei TaxID=2815326 RepID=A0ABS3H1P8_9ENTE|nr:hypothetical protein [Enterococcus sp. DIV0869a]MBO0440975.1 hypothetical protein [Enterococcus sp. DIV0869a]